MFKKQIAWASKHPVLTAAHHTAAGFGLALVLQHYLAGSLFLPVAIGWLLLAFSAAAHIYAFIQTK